MCAGTDHYLHNERAKSTGYGLWPRPSVLLSSACRHLFIALYVTLFVTLSHHVVLITLFHHYLIIPPHHPFSQLSS